MTNTKIVAVLADHGFTTLEINGCSGGSILVSNAGARVLRLIGSSGRDFLWLNNAFLSGNPEDFFSDSGWLNFGGDRTWIAPESDIFISDLNDPMNTHNVPQSIDPGTFEISNVGDGVRLASTFNMKNHRLGLTADLSMEKIVRAAPNPFRHIANASHLASAEYVGYDQLTKLDLQSEPLPNLRLGLWHLAQVRAAGKILIPVTDESKPHVYFGSVEADVVKVKPGLIEFAVPSVEPHKIGIMAASSIGRSGFLKEDEDGMWSLVVRNCLVNPSAEYIDTPWDDMNDSSYALQFFSDNGNLGDFGELEYHSPGIGYGTGITSYSDNSQLWAFRADRTTIEEIAQRLLRVKI